MQPEVFLVDPKKGLAGLEKVLGLPRPPRVIEGVDIAHLAGNETVASLVQFIDGLPFKPGYKRYRIKTVAGIDDFKSIHEVVSRRFARLVREGAPLPDIFLVDGGKGQLSAAMDALESLGIEAPCVISLAKREEEVFLPGRSEPLRLSRDSYSSGCWSTSVTRPTASRTTTTCSAASGRSTRIAEPVALGEDSLKPNNFSGDAAIVPPILLFSATGEPRAR